MTPAEQVQKQISDLKREVQLATNPYTIKAVCEKIIDTLELAIFGAISKAQDAYVPGAPPSSDANQQRVQIFPNTFPLPQNGEVQHGVPVAREFPATALLGPKAPSNGETVDEGELLEALAAFLGSRKKKALDAVAAPLPVALPPTAIPVPAAESQVLSGVVRGPNGEQVIEIYPPGDPRAPQPAKIG